jgi:hypothetical protein
LPTGNTCDFEEVLKAILHTPPPIKLKNVTRTLRFMPHIQTYKSLWIRWVHSTWKNEVGWRTDIRPNVLNDNTITHAQFILDDFSCVLIPLNDLRRTLSKKQPENNGSTIFNVNPSRRTVDDILVDLTVIESATKKKKERPKYDNIFKNWQP